jgi:hypothetical protein
MTVEIDAPLFGDGQYHEAKPPSQYEQALLERFEVSAEGEDLLY